MTITQDIANSNLTSLNKNILTQLNSGLSGAAGGDLSGNYPNPTVAKINTVALGSTTATSGNLLIGSGTSWVTNPVSGDVTINSTGVTAIGANKVLDTMLRQSAGLSLIGRSANTTGNVADITAASDFEVLRRSGSSIGFGSVNLASSNAVTGILPNANTTAEAYNGGGNTAFSIASRDTFGELKANSADSATASSTVGTGPTSSGTANSVGFYASAGPAFQGGLTNAGFLYNATTNAVTATTFIGALTGTATLASTVSTANEVSDTTCFPLFVTASGTQSLQPKNSASFAYNSASNELTTNIIEKDVAANSSTAYTIDPANGRSFAVTLDSATPTLTLASNPASGTEIELAVDIIQDGSGGRLPSWANVTWASGVAPTINPAAGSTTYLAFKGTTRGWIGYGNLQPTDSITIGGLTVVGTTNINGGELNKTRVITAAGAVTVTSADNVVIVNKTSGAATTVNLPAGVTDTKFVIKDGKGDAATNNITVTPAAGNIDGAATYVINTNYGSVTIIYNGTQWNNI